MYVQGPPVDRESQDQAAWPILVPEIVLNHFTLVRHRLFQFAYAYPTCNRLIQRVLRKFVLPYRDFLPDVVKQRHSL